jgi:hypothetical protein
MTTMYISASFGTGLILSCLLACAQVPAHQLSPEEICVAFSNARATGDIEATMNYLLLDSVLIIKNGVPEEAILKMSNQEKRELFKKLIRIGENIAQDKGITSSNDYLNMNQKPTVRIVEHSETQLTLFINETIKFSMVRLDESGWLIFDYTP